MVRQVSGAGPPAWSPSGAAGDVPDVALREEGLRKIACIPVSLCVCACACRAGWEPVKMRRQTLSAFGDHMVCRPIVHSVAINMASDSALLSAPAMCYAEVMDPYKNPYFGTP